MSASGFPLEAAAAALGERLGGRRPRVLLVLGSGLGHLAEAVDDAVAVPFAELPGFPVTSVAGHAGRFVAGELEGREILVQQGRFHVYEGHPLPVVVAPVRLARSLGVETAVFTNAAGGVRRDLRPGSLVVLDDHVNLLFRNPLTGPVVAGEERFPDMSAPYDPGLQARAVQSARRLRIPVTRGVYAAVTGPSYETPAEVRMLERMGADVVGMSTVPSVIVARAMGLRCLGISLVTNLAAGRSSEPLDHAEVVEVGRKAGAALERLLRDVLRGMDG